MPVFVPQKELKMSLVCLPSVTVLLQRIMVLPSSMVRLAGLFARAVIILDEQGKVIYTELVPEITQEPNYEQALARLS